MARKAWGRAWDDKEEKLPGGNRRSPWVKGTACTEVREKQHVGGAEGGMPKIWLRNRVGKALKGLEGNKEQ